MSKNNVIKIYNGHFIFIKVARALEDLTENRLQTYN